MPERRGGVDFGELTRGSDLWNVLALLNAGEKPTDEELAKALRCVNEGFDVPAKLLLYVADRLTGAHKPGRGRPTDRDEKRQAAESRAMRIAVLFSRVNMEHARHLHAGRRNPRELAINEVADDYNMTAEALRKVLQRDVKPLLASRRTLFLSAQAWIRGNTLQSWIAHFEEDPPTAEDK